MLWRPIAGPFAFSAASTEHLRFAPLLLVAPHGKQSRAAAVQLVPPANRKPLVVDDQ